MAIKLLKLFKMGENYFRKEEFNRKINQILIFIFGAKKLNSQMILKAFLRTEEKKKNNKTKLKSKGIFLQIFLIETIKSQPVKNQILNKLKEKVKIHNSTHKVKIQNDHLHPHTLVLLHLQIDQKILQKV